MNRDTSRYESSALRLTGRTVRTVSYIRARIVFVLPMYVSAAILHPA